MKNTIQIENQSYSYENKAELTKSESEDLAWSNTLIIFKKGFENNPLTIHFLAKDDYYMGNTLIVEMVDDVSLDNPKLIENMICFGIEKGWNPDQQGLKIGGGMNMLRALGYDVDTIDAASKRNIHEYLIKNIDLND